jgi:hypothetical protein
MPYHGVMGKLISLSLTVILLGCNPSPPPVDPQAGIRLGILFCVGLRSLRPFFFSLVAAIPR